jgi:hypothetical protein
MLEIRKLYDFQKFIDVLKCPADLYCYNDDMKFLGDHHVCFCVVISELLKPLTNISQTDGIGKSLNKVTFGLSSTPSTKGLLDVALFWILQRYIK